MALSSPFDRYELIFSDQASKRLRVQQNARMVYVVFHSPIDLNVGERKCCRDSALRQPRQNST
jgi:hypothetical protein